MLKCVAADMSRCVKDLLVVQDKQLADFASNQVTMVEAEVIFLQ